MEQISIRGDGYVFCKSSFYCAQNVLSYDWQCTINRGKNRLVGDIDSGYWAISYILSMYNSYPEDFILFGEPEILINTELVPIDKMLQISCYMDKLYPLFSSNSSVKELVIRGLSSNNLNLTVNDVQDMFEIDRERFERPIAGVGNEIFRAMSAIGYACGKEIFCFPWMSKMRCNTYRRQLQDVVDKLESLDKFVLLPINE